MRSALETVRQTENGAGDCAMFVELYGGTVHQAEMPALIENTSAVSPAAPPRGDGLAIYGKPATALTIGCSSSAPR
jgi:hypothetical protein